MAHWVAEGSYLQGSVALCRRADHRALRRAERFVVDHSVVAAVDAVSSRPDCAAVFHYSRQDAGFSAK